tara:strand:- start:284 stop:415 length:132 start_codon:yes stop_codon:yes gene_type:complete
VRKKGSENVGTLLKTEERGGWQGREKRIQGKCGAVRREEKVIF